MSFLIKLRNSSLEAFAFLCYLNFSFGLVSDTRFFCKAQTGFTIVATFLFQHPGAGIKRHPCLAWWIYLQSTVQLLYNLLYNPRCKTCLKLYFSALCVWTCKELHPPPKKNKLNDISQLITDPNSLVNYRGFSYEFNHMTNHQRITVWKRLQHTGHSDEPMS